MVKKSKKLLFICFFSFCLIAFEPQFFIFAGENAAVQVIDAEDATPRAPRIDWRYKVENGKLYRRLYNYTYQEWVGEWELCP